MGVGGFEGVLLQRTYVVGRDISVIKGRADRVRALPLAVLDKNFYFVLFLFVRGLFLKIVT